MNKEVSREIIKEARTNKGLSQEALAELSNISLRTIQRIEKGDVVPRASTLKILADKLDLNISELTNKKPDVLNTESGIIKKMNLSIIISCLIPLCNIILPMAIWKYNTRKLNEMQYLAGKVLSFQIIWTIVALCVLFMSVLLSNLITGEAGNSLFVSLITYLIWVLFNIIFALKHMRELSHGKIQTLSFVPNFF